MMTKCIHLEMKLTILCRDPCSESTKLHLSLVMDKTSLSGLDNFYLQVEKAWKLKTLSSVWIFDERLDSGLVHQTLDWLCDTYPQYASVPAHGSMFHTASWTRPIGWQPKMNVEHYRLKTPTREALEEYIADKVVVIQ